jgi:hypothetical protein
MEEKYHEHVAFKIEQSKLDEEVSRVNCSLTKMTEDILRIRWDMLQLSTNLWVELAELKSLLLDMTDNKRCHKQRRNKDTDVASSSLSGDHGGEQATEVFNESAHEMETPWDSMCESEREKEKTSHARVTQGCSTPGQGKLAGVY